MQNTSGSYVRRIVQENRVRQHTRVCGSVSAAQSTEWTPKKRSHSPRNCFVCRFTVVGFLSLHLSINPPHVPMDYSGAHFMRFQARCDCFLGPNARPRTYYVDRAWLGRILRRPYPCIGACQKLPRCVVSASVARCSCMPPCHFLTRSHRGSGGGHVCEMRRRGCGCRVCAWPLHGRRIGASVQFGAQRLPVCTQSVFCAFGAPQRDVVFRVHCCVVLVLRTYGC